jgi:hypothetical protein
MEDFETLSETLARQAVDLFASSPVQVPAREDVEIAASLLGGDSPSFMRLFDTACQIRALAAGMPDQTVLGTSFSKVRTFAAGRIAAGDVGTLEGKVGGRISGECIRRLWAAKEDGALRQHHLATAADHYASDVMEALSSLIGQPAEGFTMTVGEDFDVGSLLNLPFLCFLHPLLMEASNA